LKKNHSFRFELINLVALLNFLNDVILKEDLLLFMTMNHLNALNKALMHSRKIDKCVKFMYVIFIELHDVFFNIYFFNVDTYVVNNEIYKLMKQFNSAVS